jgi:hypothetical protein
MLDIEVGSQLPWSKDTLASGMRLESQLTRLSTLRTTLTVRVKDLPGDALHSSLKREI